MSQTIHMQSPWLAAAEGFGQITNPLARMYQELPQIRAQMQQHADRMGIQQGGLDLQQQELGLKAPVYQAQAANYSAGASKDEAAAKQILELIRYAQAASQSNTNPTQSALLGSTGLDPSAAQRAFTEMTQPLTLNSGETAFNPQTFAPVAQGMVSAPFGNTVLGGMATGGTNQPPVIQQGQFRPPGESGGNNPILDAYRLAQIMAMGEYDALPGVQTDAFAPVLQRLIMQQQGQSQGGGQTNAPKIKSIRQIK